MVDEKARDALKRVHPGNPAKGSVRYDMRKNPSDYMAATHRLCLERASHLQTGERQEEKQSKKRETRDFCFAPAVCRRT